MAASSHRGRVTRADVARLAGVSTAVVSYVLNNGPGPVAPATRERVLNAVSALGYRPNATARALATGSTHLLGLVVPDISNPLFAEFALSIESRANAKGYGLLLANSEDDEAIERKQVANLVGRGADGILLASVLPKPDLPKAGSTRYVVLNSLAPRSGVISIGPDALSGARIATDHLISHGHTSVALVIGHSNSAVVEARETGWLQSLSSHDLAPGPIGRDEFTREGGYRAAKRIFSTPGHPSAVFVSSDLQAIGALSALRELGLRVPEDVAVISFDGTAESEFSAPPLTTVRQPLAAMAARVIDLVTDPVEPPSGHELYPVELVLRKSCGAHEEPGRTAHPGAPMPPGH